MQPKRIAQLIREAAEAKLAEDPVLLDLTRLPAFARYFFITHGNSDRHVRAIAYNIQEELEKHQLRSGRLEGIGEGRWVLLDYGSIVAHVFHRDLREFYGLERLWGAAPKEKP